MQYCTYTKERKEEMTTKFLQQALTKSKKAANNGFTLIELMVVVVIVGVLSAVGVPQLLAANDKAKDAAAKAEVVNAAKTCSLDLLTGSSGYVADDFPLLTTSTCEVSADLVATSQSSEGPTFTISLDAAGLPSTPVEGTTGSI